MKNPLETLKEEILERMEKRLSEKLAEDIPKVRVAILRVFLRAGLIELQREDPGRGSSYTAALETFEGD